MVNKLFTKSRNFLVGPQSSVLSAASIIMVMIIASRVLGLIRQRVLAHFFVPGDLALFFAAFRLPDLVFEVLVFGTFSSAFIPVFSKALQKGNHHAWDIASTVVNIGLLIFSFLAIILSFNAHFLYGVLAPGFADTETETIANLARMLFAAQGFFVISYVLTGVLESLRRFLVPALAPLFYNVGIIAGTILWANEYGLRAPAYGVVIGAAAHFVIQLPLAYKLGFRFMPAIGLSEDVKKIGRLALPRLIEVSFLQVAKVAELYFASLISTASYTYYTFANSLQLLPVGLFGTSIAKAALPTLSIQSDEPEKFNKTLLGALYQMAFLTAPIATILVILRVPAVRLVYGTDIFGWEATVQTGYVLSAFAVGIVFQAAAGVLARSFYALHDTKTPVAVSITSILVTIFLDYLFIRIMGFSVWGLAAAYSVGSIIQTSSLFYLINKKVIKRSILQLTRPVIKIFLASVSSGFIMYFLLKIFDRSVWIKRLSFLGGVDTSRYLTFKRFVLDTRYTANLLVLTVLVSLIGLVVYVAVLALLRSEELLSFRDMIRKIVVKHKVTPIPQKEQETVSPTPGDGAL